MYFSNFKLFLRFNNLGFRHTGYHAAAANLVSTIARDLTVWASLWLISPLDCLRTSLPINLLYIHVWALWGQVNKWIWLPTCEWLRLRLLLCCLMLSCLNLMLVLLEVAIWRVLVLLSYRLFRWQNWPKVEICTIVIATNNVSCWVRLIMPSRLTSTRATIEV